MAVVERHTSKRSLLQDFHVTAAFANDREQRVRQFQARSLDVCGVGAEVAGDLRPSGIERFADCLEGIWPKRCTIDELSSAHGRMRKSLGGVSAKSMNKGRRGN
jgi:hypothetical protein